jgi:hypothetical protein
MSIESGNLTGGGGHVHFEVLFTFRLNKSDRPTWKGKVRGIVPNGLNRRRGLRISNLVASKFQDFRSDQNNVVKGLAATIQM